MMPTTYAKLIPPTPVPNYKYANEEAGESLARSFIFGNGSYLARIMLIA